MPRVHMEEPLNGWRQSRVEINVSVYLSPLSAEIGSLSGVFQWEEIVLLWSR